MSGICECHNHDEMMGQPLCFSLFVCVFCDTVCFMPVSPVSWHIYHVYVWVLCLDRAVIVFQTCGVSSSE